MAIGEEIRFDAPDNVCFGCSQHNERGMQLTFRHVRPSGVEGSYTAPEQLCGAPGVVHGGIQAALLDEAIGFAVHAHNEDGGSSSAGWADRQRVVTVEFDLRYRRPAPTGVELAVRADVVHVDGDDFLAVADIRGADGAVLTSATARWRRLR